MDDHNEMYEIGLTAPMEMAEEYRLDEMLPMMGLKIGKRCIILISRSVSAAEILDTLETLRCGLAMAALSASSPCAVSPDVSSEALEQILSDSKEEE